MCLILIAYPLLGFSSYDESQYKLSTGDIISISVLNEKELSLDIRINETGFFDYPLLGKLRVSGLSTDELKEHIYAGLKGRFLIKPDVQVRIMQYRDFYIRGEVKTPGGYPYMPGLTIEKAVAIAGGFGERAARKEITLVRGGVQSHEALSEKVLPGDIIRINKSYF